MNIDYSIIAKRMASRRAELRITQSELADKTGLTPKYISNIETSHSIPSIETVMKICSALDVTPDYLLLGIATEKELAKLEELNRMLKSCNDIQLSKIHEYIEFVMSR